MKVRDILKRGKFFFYADHEGKFPIDICALRSLDIKQ